MIFSLNVWVLGNFIWKIENPFAKLLFDMPKSFQSHMMSYLENLILICCLLLHWALSNCCDPCENSFHAFMIKIHVHTISPCYTSTLEVSIVSLIHSIKIKLHVLCDLSLSLQKSGWKKETWAMKKERKKIRKHNAQIMSEKMSKAWKKERKIAHVQNKEGKGERCDHAKKKFQ
jgi:hypothetical protein